MDLKGSLSSTHLNIYPSESFTKFLNSLPDDADIPTNILKFIGRNSKGNLNEEETKANVVNFTNEDENNIKDITDYVKANTKPETEASDTNKVVKEKNEMEKSGDTPEKHGKEKTDTKKSKKKIGEKSNKKIGDSNDFNQNILDKDSEAEIEEKQPDKEDIPEKEPEPCLSTSDIDWLYQYLQTRRTKDDSVPYLHVLLEGSRVETPENTILKRNPELEARCVKLRAQAEARAYRKMTKGVDNVRMRFPEDSISYQMKQLNRHLIAIGQFILSIFAGFMFGFKGIEWTIGHLEFGFRLLLGVMCALIIALAEIYFLAKKLNEELSIPETVQLGGPVKFVDEPKYRHLPSKPIGKEHQD